MLCRHAGDDLLWREMFAAAATSRDRDVDETLVELSKEILDIASDAGVYRGAAGEISEITWYQRNVETLLTQWRNSYEGTSRESKLIDVDLVDQEHKQTTSVQATNVGIPRKGISWLFRPGSPFLLI